MGCYQVLVVDDYPDAAATIATLLELLGHVAHPAVNGEDALALARMVQFDVALVDIGLPDRSGYDVARALREQAGGRPMFIAAITGSSEPTDRVRALAAGFDHHALKPIDLRAVTRILELAYSSRNR